MGGTENVDLVDLVRPNHRDRPEHLRVPGKFGIQKIAAFPGEFLGIVQKRARKWTGKNDRRRCDWPGKGPPARFIDPRNASKAPGDKCVL